MKFLLCFIFICSFVFKAGSQIIIEVSDDVDERQLRPHQVSLYADTANQLSFGEISSPGFVNRFKIYPSYQNKDFKKNIAYWIRLSIKHTTSTRKVWLLEFYDQTIDHLEAYLPAGQTYRKIVMGDQQSFGSRLLPHKNFEIVLDMDSDTVEHYYFKVQSDHFADMRVGLRSVNRFIYYALNEYLLFGIFYGMMLIISLYNFLVYLAIREKKNLYYIFYIVSVALYALSYDGIGFQYLWPDFPALNNYAVGITLYSVILWALVFTRTFLNTAITAYKLDFALKGMIAARTALFFIHLFFLPQLLTVRIIEIIPLTLILLTGIYVWRRGYRPARFFVIAHGILFTGFLIRSLVYVNVFPFNTWSHYSLHFSFAFEMLFLTFALGDRIRILKNMRNRALERIIRQHEVNIQLKSKVNRELEQRILERTLELEEKNHELEETNRKLEEQARQFNQINSMLDLDNWKLKSSIKEVLSERLVEKTMGYPQFKTLYPNALACYRFLENLKWSEGYTCRKCNNQKFFNGSQKFSRRCTRCGYNESIIAYTIFHGIKFPIERAFYITYLSVTGKNDYTLEMLAQQLDLRVNVVWNFRKKVTDTLKLMHQRVPASSLRWHHVILSAGKAAVTYKKAPIQSVAVARDLGKTIIKF